MAIWSMIIMIMTERALSYPELLIELERVITVCKNITMQVKQNKDIDTVSKGVLDALFDIFAS